MDYREHLVSNIQSDFRSAIEERARLQEDKRTVIDRLAFNMTVIGQIMEAANTLGIKLQNVELSEDPHEPQENEVRDWIQKNETFSLIQFMAELNTTRATAEQWIDFFIEKGTIAAQPDAIDLYRFVRPGKGGPKRRPRSSPPPSTAPDAPKRGMPVEGTGDAGYPEHVRRVVGHLVDGVAIERKGNGHIHFTVFLGPEDEDKRFTWTSTTPRSVEDEHAQLVRRLKDEGMWRD